MLSLSKPLAASEPQSTSLDLKCVRFPPDVSCFWGLWPWTWGFWILVVPGKWQLQGHKWTAEWFVSCFSGVLRRWQSHCGGSVCVVAAPVPFSDRQLWGAGSPCGSGLLTWVPQAGSRAPKGTEDKAQEDTGLKPRHLEQAVNSHQRNALEVQAELVWVLYCFLPIGSSSHSWMGAGWCSRLDWNKSWMYFGRASHGKVNLLNLKTEVENGTLISEGQQSQN